MEIITPKLKGGERIAAVYKITFDDTYFYYGSSENMYGRVSLWRKKIKRRTVNSRMRQVLEACATVKLEIIELVEFGQSRKAEDNYIKKFWGNPYLLNISPNAFSSAGIKFTDEELRCRKKKTGVKLSVDRKEALRISAVDRFAIDREKFMRGEPAKPILAIDKNGVYKSYPSINVASKTLSIHSGNICKVLKGVRRKTNGYVFKYSLALPEIE